MERQKKIDCSLNLVKMEPLRLEKPELSDGYLEMREINVHCNAFGKLFFFFFVFGRAAQLVGS